MINFIIFCIWVAILVVVGGFFLHIIFLATIFLFTSMTILCQWILRKLRGKNASDIC